MSQTEPSRPSVLSRLLGIAGILLAHLLALSFIMMALVKIVPTYAIFFEHQAVALPVATQRIVMWSDFWCAYWYLLMALALLIDTVVVVTLAFVFARRRWVLSAYSHFGLVATSALLIYIVAWLSHPVYNSVRQPPRNAAVDTIPEPLTGDPPDEPTATTP